MNNFIKQHIKIMDQARYCLLPWIDDNKLNKRILNYNENAVQYVIFNDIMYKRFLFQNKNAFYYCKNYLLHTQKNEEYYKLRILFCLVEHPGIVDFVNRYGYNQEMFTNMCKNPYCISIIEKNINKFYINYIYLALNKNAIPLIRKYINTEQNINDEYLWKNICRNESADAIKLLEENPDKIDWDILSSNPYAISLLEKNKSQINYWYLSANRAAIHLIEERLKWANWICLSKNPNAIHILKRNQEKIDWCTFSENVAIFEPDYKQMSLERSNILREDLMKKALHPTKIQYWLENGLTIDDVC
jgi:hypothetical protein